MQCTLAVINSSCPKLRLVDELKKPLKEDVAKPEQTLENVERGYIKRVLEGTGWKVSGKNSAAEILDEEQFGVELMNNQKGGNHETNEIGIRIKRVD